MQKYRSRSRMRTKGENIYAGRRSRVRKVLRTQKEEEKEEEEEEGQG